MMDKLEPTILIVDDEQDISDLLATVLKREGFNNIQTASSAKQGREAFLKYLPDLVLLDIMLPDGDGHSL